MKSRIKLYSSLTLLFIAMVTFAYINYNSKAFKDLTPFVISTLALMTSVVFSFLALKDREKEVNHISLLFKNSSLNPVLHIRNGSEQVISNIFIYVKYGKEYIPALVNPEYGKVFTPALLHPIYKQSPYYKIYNTHILLNSKSNIVTDKLYKIARLPFIDAKSKFNLHLLPTLLLNIKDEQSIIRAQDEIIHIMNNIVFVFDDTYGNTWLKERTQAAKLVSKNKNDKLIKSFNKKYNANLEIGGIAPTYVDEV